MTLDKDLFSILGVPHPPSSNLPTFHVINAAKRVEFGQVDIKRQFADVEAVIYFNVAAPPTPTHTALGVSEERCRLPQWLAWPGSRYAKRHRGQ